MYDSAYEMLCDIAPEFLSQFSEEQIDSLRGEDDFESYGYQVINGKVIITDMLTGDAFLSEPMEEFLAGLLSYLNK